MAKTESEELAALRRLDQIWIELANLVRTCDVTNEITPEADRRHHELLREASGLYGRLRPIIGTAGVTWSGRYFDGFQGILGQPSLSAIYQRPFAGSSDWHELWGVTSSAIGQAIGRAEEAERQGPRSLSPEVVSRYRPLISALEGVRQALAAVLGLAVRPFHLLDPIVSRLERWPLIRLLVLIGAAASGVTVIVVGVIFVL